MRLNLGSGPEPLPGWTNIDLHPPADILGDFTNMDFSNVDEIRMSHVLEHISWRSTTAVLRRVHSWMNAGAMLTVEVPNMRQILARGTGYPGGTGYPDWQQWIYGEQSHEGERHLAGFTAQSLVRELRAAGFECRAPRTFISDNKMRVGYPCLEVVAVAA